MKRFKIYLIGYQPPGFMMSREIASRLISECDCCCMAAGPMPIGMEFDVAEQLLDSLSKTEAPPRIGERLRVVAHEHKGKVIIAEVVPLS